MYGIYDDIIDAAKRTLRCFDETKDLLEFPEVQADKAYYLSVLAKFNTLNAVNEKLSALVSVLENERTASALLSDAGSEEERAALFEEISELKKSALKLSSSLADALGCNHIKERAYCRFKFKGESAAKFGLAFYNLVKADLLLRGAVFEDEKVEKIGGFVREIEFDAEGTDVLTRLIPLAGAHKVYISGAKSEELCFAVTPSAGVEEIKDGDLKIDLFHSAGAGGQNVNKVETAVRVTHIPSGLSVVCQDERSQLKNKNRALETIEKRIREKNEQKEKKRIDADISAQFARKNTPISFDAAGNTMTDTRLRTFNKIPFPMNGEQFASYINGLIAL